MHSRTWTFFEDAWHEGNVSIMGVRTHAAWMSSSVFDGARSFEGVAPDLDLHCARVNASAEAFGLAAVVAPGRWAELARDGIARFGPDPQLYIRPMYWAEAGYGGGVMFDPATTRWCLSVYEAPMPKPAGVSITLSRFRRPTADSALVEAKAGCLYPNGARALAEAKARGFDNAVMLDAGGRVAELANANLFLVKNGVVFTPAPNGTFLAGITRARVIGLLRRDGVEVVEGTLDYADVAGADEVFSTGNYAKVVPVTRGRRGGRSRRARSGRGPGPSTGPSPTREASRPRDEAPDPARHPLGIARGVEAREHAVGLGGVGQARTAQLDQRLRHAALELRVELERHGIPARVEQRGMGREGARQQHGRAGRRLDHLVLVRGRDGHARRPVHPRLGAVHRVIVEPEPPALAALLDAAPERFRHDLMAEAQADHAGPPLGGADEILERRDPGQAVVDPGRGAGDHVGGVILGRARELAVADRVGAGVEALAQHPPDHGVVAAVAGREVGRRDAGLQDADRRHGVRRHPWSGTAPPCGPRRARGR